MENSQDIDKFIRKLCSMTLTELKELKERDRIELEALEAEYKAEKIKNARLKERYRKVGMEAHQANITREKTKQKIAILEHNMREMQKTLMEFDQDKTDLTKFFHESYGKTKGIKKLLDDKCLELRGLRDEFRKNFNKLQTEIKDAHLQLAHKKESLAANQQVLESKKACLEKDYQDCVKKAKELKSLTGKNNKDVLKEMEQMEDDMKMEFSNLSAKLAELMKQSEDLDANKALLTVETDKLSLELAVEEKCNQKLEVELKNELQNVEQLAYELATSDVNAVHCDNIELAKILRDDLIENQQILKEIELLEMEKIEVEKINQEFDVIKEQKLDQLKVHQAMISGSIEKKILLEKEVADLKKYVAEKQKISQAIKMKTAEKEEALKKLVGAAKVPQLTVIKGTTQPKNFKVTEIKTSRTKRQKNKKKEPPVSKPKASTQIPTEPMNISNNEESDGFSMSSEMAGK